MHSAVYLCVWVEHTGHVHGACGRIVLVALAQNTPSTTQLIMDVQEMVSAMGSEMESLSDVEQERGHKQLLKTHMKQQSGLTYIDRMRWANRGSLAVSELTLARAQSLCD